MTVSPYKIKCFQTNTWAGANIKAFCSSGTLTQSRVVSCSWEGPTPNTTTVTSTMPTSAGRPTGRSTWMGKGSDNVLQSTHTCLVSEAMHKTFSWKMFIECLTNLSDHLSLKTRKTCLKTPEIHVFISRFEPAHWTASRCQKWIKRNIRALKHNSILASVSTCGGINHYNTV